MFHFSLPFQIIFSAVFCLCHSQSTVFFCQHIPQGCFPTVRLHMQQKDLGRVYFIHKPAGLRRRRMEAVAVAEDRHTSLSARFLADNDTSLTRRYVQVLPCMYGIPVHVISHIREGICNRPALRFQQHRNLRKHMFQEPEQIQVLGNAPGNQVNLFPFLQISSDRGLETLVVIRLVPGFPCV